MKNLIVYYSKTPHVDQLVESLSGDKVKIELKKPFPNFKPFLMFIAGYHSVTGKERELMPLEVNPDEYDQITIVTPVWAGRPAIPVLSFLKNYPFKSKEVNVIFSYDGNYGHSDELIKPYLEGNTIKEMKGFIKSTFDKVIYED